MRPLVATGLRLSWASWVMFLVYFAIPGRLGWVAATGQVLAVMGLWDLLVAWWMRTGDSIAAEFATSARFRRSMRDFRQSMTEFDRSMAECQQALASVRMMQEGFMPVASCPDHGLVWTVPGQDRVKALAWHRSCSYREIGRHEPPRCGKSDLSLLMLAQALSERYPPRTGTGHVHEIDPGVHEGVRLGPYLVCVLEGEHCIICAERAGAYDEDHDA